MKVKEKDRIVAAITSLIRKTQDGVLEWKTSSPTDVITEGTETLVDTVYLARKDDRPIRLYAYRRKCYTEEDVWYWGERVALELSDESGTSWWRFPEHPAIWDLLEAVRFKTVGVDQFIEKLLSE